jgi:predicted RNA-binding Zn-ribbon protein involved in translation (DUF1610 family)
LFVGSYRSITSPRQASEFGGFFISAGLIEKLSDKTATGEGTCQPEATAHRRTERVSRHPAEISRAKITFPLPANCLYRMTRHIAANLAKDQSLMASRKISLKVIAAPATGAVLDAPPILHGADQSVDYTCGQCGTILLHAEENRVHSIVIHCGNCGSYNSTDG